MSHLSQPHEEPQAGDGVELTVTEARAGVRRGVSKILVISTVLAGVALSAAWIFAPRPAAPPATAPASVAQGR
jgi:hypothetical protein